MRAVEALMTQPQVRRAVGIITANEMSAAASRIVEVQKVCSRALVPSLPSAPAPPSLPLPAPSPPVTTEWRHLEWPVARP